MNLTGLASSQAPNAIAVFAAVVLAFSVFKLRISTDWRRWALVLAVLSVAAVVAKNVVYALVISAPTAENSKGARLFYASTLLVVLVFQFGIAVSLLATSVGAGRLAWLFIFAALAHAWAGACMISWRGAYLAVDAAKPVQFKLQSPGMHWLLLTLMAMALVMAVVSLTRRHSPRKRR